MSPVSRFDDIRPYNDQEIPAAMQRLAKEPLLDHISSWVFPEKPADKLRELMLAVKNIDEFQQKVIRSILISIIEKTMSEFSYSGQEYLQPGKGILYISNHRDIVLDTALLQLVLYLNGLPTTEISFGSNLMQLPQIIDLGKSNKMFKVFRKEGNMRDLIKHSRHLSDYIRDRTGRGISMWIAQHEGRSKDGNDKTDPGLLRMLSLSGKSNALENLASLNIQPLSVTYEIEPCDISKVKEEYLKSLHGSYTKDPGEDLASIVTGITQYKGKVHMSLCPPVTAEDMEPFAHLQQGAFFREIAALINRRIYDGYKLYGINYAACDLLSGKQEFIEHYTDEDLKLLEQREILLTDQEPAWREAMIKMLRQLYATPVLNKKKEGL